MLLTETNCFLLDAHNIISENKAKGVMKLKGTFQRADEVNANGRLYKRRILEREIKKLQPFIEENRLLGELDHPESEVVKLSNASHMVTKLGWDGNDVIGECTLLNTPAGLTAQTLIRDGVKIGISSRGLGTLTEIGESVKEVNDDFDMRTFDLVADPSTRGAFPGLSESKNYIAEGTKIIEKCYKKAISERVLYVGLKNKLDSIFSSPKDMINEAFTVETYGARSANSKKYHYNPPDRLKPGRRGKPGQGPAKRDRMAVDNPAAVKKKEKAGERKVPYGTGRGRRIKDNARMQRSAMNVAVKNLDKSHKEYWLNKICDKIEELNIYRPKGLTLRDLGIGDNHPLVRKKPSPVRKRPSPVREKPSDPKDEKKKNEERDPQKFGFRMGKIKSKSDPTRWNKAKEKFLKRAKTDRQIPSYKRGHAARDEFHMGQAYGEDK